MLKAVTFDLWNTLIQEKNYLEPRTKCLARKLNDARIFLNFQEIKDAYIAGHDYVREVWRKENYRYVPTSERLDYILSKMHVKLSADTKRELIRDMEELVLLDSPNLVDGAKETVKAIKSAYKTGIICDTSITPGNVLREVLKTHDLFDFFDVTIFSNEIGYNKPHRMMFKTALSALNSEPHEAIHVGDLLQTDVTGAKTIGMKIIWLNRKGEPDTGTFKPDYEIRFLPQITEVLNIIKESDYKKA